MEFENTFDVPAPIDEVYDALLDVERVAPCVPGAEVLEHTGEDSYKVAIKVKVGPMSMQYRGDVEIVEKDAEAHRAVMRAKAREARGQGMVTANVMMTLAGEDGRTHGTIATDVQLSGRVAAMGRGIIQDVSARIVDQFAQNLAAMLSGPEATEEPAGAAPAEAATPAAGPAPAAAGGTAREAGAAPTQPRPAPAAGAPAQSELSALDIAGSVVAGRLKDPKTLGAVLAIVALLGFLLGRRR
jgi:carbon monoxide dehydrogenase subunit G